MNVTLDCFETFAADVMLYLAGIFRGGFFVDAKRHQPGGEQFVALVHGFGDFPAAFPSFVTVI